MPSRLIRPARIFDASYAAPCSPIAVWISVIGLASATALAVRGTGRAAEARQTGRP